MGLENIEDIEMQCKVKKTSALLEEMSKMPALKDLDYEVMIAKRDNIVRMDGGSYGTYHRLYLTNKGIIERTQHSSAREISGPRDQIINKPSEFENIVSLYDITPQGAKKLYSMLKN
jgi:hypothetical protein